MKPFLPLVFAAIVFAAPPTTETTPAIDADKFLAHVKYLASPEMRGRATGSPELEKAADYIARQFRSIGLKPLQGDSYFQPFSVTTNARLGHDNRFEYTEGGTTQKLKPGEDFRPFNFSSRGKVRGGVVFAGYGITAQEYHYDDYEGLNVKDKLVLILRHEPQEFDEHSVFDGKIYTEHAQFASKATNAKNHGARGVILINDTFNHRGEADDLEKFERTVGPGDAGIPFVQIKEEVAARWISDAGRSLEEIATAIDRDLKPQSFALRDSIEVREEIDLERAVKTVRNVAGYLPGETAEYAIIGAHYDHLGLGEQYSMAPQQAGTAVHPGADDNASGTAGVIELARWFAGQPKQKRGILFMTFAGEELGLLGSSYYVRHPEMPLARAVAMINLDMIGRVREGKVYIGGVATGSNLRATLEPLLAHYPMHIDFSDTTGYGSSDHTSFTTQQVPVLFFFSGLHGDYHKPSDTWDKIDAPDSAKLLGLIAEVGKQLCSEEERPLFVRVEEPKNPHAGSIAGSSSSGYGPEFGSVPDFTEIPNGVRFADIRPGTPAAQAGLKAGDILVEFDGKPISNLYDFTYALRSKKPGDMVTVKVLRGSDTVTASVLLRQRK
ncbi:MAG TPA: M28 family peptidase [Bryobacteraceae bacterium]|nr:M28 family peptidase [Bryobacteraceae bacterium]